MKQLSAPAWGLLALAGLSVRASADPPPLPPWPTPTFPSASADSGPYLAPSGQAPLPAAAANPQGLGLNPRADAVLLYHPDLPPPQSAAPLSPPPFELPTFQAVCDDCRAFISADHGGHFIAGAGFYYLKPFFDGNPAYTVQVNGATPGGNGTATLQVQEDFHFDAGWAPLIWFGYVGETGLGFRIRWWQFQEGDRSAAVDAEPPEAATLISAAPRGLAVQAPGPLLANFGTGADQMAFETDLALNVWDIEAIQDLRCGRWALLVSAGIRYAHLAQNYDAYRFNHGEGGATFFTDDSSVLRSGHNFNGAGPTVALEVRRPLGESGLALYGIGRGSLLFGCAYQQADLLKVESGTRQGGALVTNTALNDAQGSRDQVLPVAELELGAEYGRVFGTVHPFIRTGVLAQSWFGAGNGSSLAGNLGLLGWTLMAGVDF